MSDKLVKRDQAESIVNHSVGGFLVPSAMAEALLRQGISPTVVSKPEVVHHAKVSWEQLCDLSTRDRKTMVSPAVVVTLVDANPDAPQEFEAYKGMVRFEFTTEFGATLFGTHAMTYASTGELLPLWAWMKEQQVPFLARFGHIETRNSERHVVKPVPIDIEVM